MFIYQPQSLISTESWACTCQFWFNHWSCGQNSGICKREILVYLWNLFSMKFVLNKLLFCLIAVHFGHLVMGLLEIRSFTCEKKKACNKWRMPLPFLRILITIRIFDIKKSVLRYKKSKHIVRCILYTYTNDMGARDPVNLFIPIWHHLSYVSDHLVDQCILNS